MILLYLILFVKLSFGIIISNKDRISARKITCLNGSSYLFNCEACLVITRNYAIQTTLSLTGSGAAGVTFACLLTDQIEIYHENLVRECQNFPKGTLNGYDDFCVASPFSKLRGTYRACMCIANACNMNHSECVQRANPYWDQTPQIFQNTIVTLTNRIKCYRPYEDNAFPTHSSLTNLCSPNDAECKNFLFDHGVLCAISVDRTNLITRQTFPPSIYSSEILKFRTKLCKSFTWTTKSIYFSQCQQGETVCMCTVDGCDKDLETCRKSKGTYINYHSILYFILLLINI